MSGNAVQIVYIHYVRTRWEERLDIRTIGISIHFLRNIRDIYNRASLALHIIDAGDSQNELMTNNMKKI